MPLKVYECDYYKVLVPDVSCLFCSHCTDVFWDFTHGPYMFICDVGADTEEGAQGRCNRFDEEDCHEL